MSETADRKKLDPWIKAYILLAIVLYVFIIGFLIGDGLAATREAPALPVVAIKIERDNQDGPDDASSDLAPSASGEGGDDNG